MASRPTIIALLLSGFMLAGCSSAPQTDTALPEPTPAMSASEFTDARLALAEGTKLLDMGDTERAIEVLKRAIELNPDLADAYFQLGIAYALIETRDAAVIEEQITPTPTPGEKKQRESTKDSEKAFEQAAEAYKKQIAANDEDHHSYFNLGRAYNKLNEDEEAAKALRQAVRLNPEDTEYQTELGAILVKLAQYREAISPLKKAIELDPENSRAMNLLDDAEAGRRRIDFVTDKKDANKSTNSNANTSESNTVETPPASSNTSKPPAQSSSPRPSPRQATPRPASTRPG